MDLHLRGKRVLITGASKGSARRPPKPLPRKAPSRLAARGGDQLKALPSGCAGAPDRRQRHVVDLRKPEDIARLAKEAADIDILVNNAGDIPGGSIDKIDEPTWRHAWELKVFGYINLTRAYRRPDEIARHGVIVNDIGAAGEKFDANYICGSAGNAALMAFTRALGGKSLAENIRVVGINSGPARTDRHVTLLKTRAKHQFGDETARRNSERPAARPSRASRADRRPHGIPRFRLRRLYFRRDLTVHGGISADGTAMQSHYCHHRWSGSDAHSFLSYPALSDIDLNNYSKKRYGLRRDKARPSP